MHVVACAAPVGSLEPAPLTSMPLASTLGNVDLSAFWSDDDAYYVKATGNESASEQWYRFEADEVPIKCSQEEREEIARLMADIIPMGGGRVAFPVGSTGRRFYRVWRTGSSSTGSRTRILEVRAARSRRLPA